MQSAQNTWYVQVNGQAYGPYDASQMQGFVTEGRVNAESMISQSAAQGYAPAAQFPVFTQWSGLQMQAQVQQTAPQAHVLRPVSNVGGGVLARQMQPTTHAPQALAPNPTPVQQTHITPQVAPQPAANTVFIVMAEIRSGNGMQFLQALQNEGLAQRIGDSVWLLRSGTRVEQLRNRLSQALTRDDRLFMLDSFKNETAWFNIGSNMDVCIRELWDMER
jgi:hypothetical protein